MSRTAATAMQFARSHQLRAKAHRCIPGGCHSYSKGDDQYPQLSPGFIARGRGSHVWDVDGNEFIEYGMGNRCVTLGHAFPPVIEAAAAELAKGCNFTRPAEIEVRAAETLQQLIPTAEMVKFCKNGSDATTAAIKLARAYTGRDRIACCRDQPFFASNDWFMGTTPLDAGIPQSTKDLTLGFSYNDLDDVRRLFAQHPDSIAALILEPAKYEDPRDGFLQQVQALCHAHGALFILDELITGFRWDNGGGQAVYGIDPDLSCWGKALGNGFAVSALTGKRQYMELGGLDHERERVFLLSTTHGAETHALAAAIATMRTYQHEPVIQTLYARGRRLQHEAAQAIAAHGLQDQIQIIGRPCCLTYTTLDASGVPSLELRSLLLQETIRRGVLMSSLVVSYTHTDEDIDRTIEAFDGALAIYRQALEQGVDGYLIGRPAQPLYRRYNNTRR